MKLLRLKIFQLNASYKIPYAPSINLTYPIPPFSTVIGFLCNILGIKDQYDPKFIKLKENLYLGIYGNFKSIAKEFVWLRTLAKENHIERFESKDSREYNGYTEHPGGQVPNYFFTLEDVKLIIYILSSQEILECIRKSILDDYKANSILHLGRAEDLILFDGNSNEAVKIIEISENKKPLYENIDYYTWIPDPILSKESGDNTFYQNT
ncbi:MAG: type I-B CRISPR-associated protein Cas5b, partial [bacterium]